MTNKKATKRALLSTVLSLVLCFSMLLGTTFAWFTDSVTSANNIITSGNLDIEFEFWDGTEWVDVNGRSDILTNNYWEPGVTEVAYLRVKNAGTLALKYQLGINIVDEKPGRNVAGDPFKLSDYIMFGVFEGINGETGEYESREDAMNEIEGLKRISAGYTKASTLAAGDDAQYFALVVYMPVTIGNEANHNGTDVPAINLGLNVIATQLNSEEDSFDNKYDKPAVYADYYVTTAEELATALNAGGITALMADIELPYTKTGLTVDKGVSSTLNLNGYNITASSSSTGANQNAIIVKGKLSVEGVGTVSTEFTGENMGWNNSVSVFSVEGGTLNLGAGVNVVNKGGSNMAYGVDANSTGGLTIVNVNGAVVDSTYTAIRLFNNSQAEIVTVNVNNGYLSGDSRDLWVHNPSAKAIDKNAIVTFADGYTYDTTVQSEASFYGRIYQLTTAVTNSANSMMAAVGDGMNVVLTEDVLYDIDTTGEDLILIAPAGVSFDGNGSTITVVGADTAAGNYNYVGFVPAKGEAALVENVTVAGIGFVEVGHYGNGSGNYTVNNLTVVGLETTLAVVDGGRKVSAAFAQYGTATLNNCKLTDTICGAEGFTAYDIGCVNGTTTTILNSEVGSIYLWAQAKVTIGAGTEVDTITSAAITYKNLGKLTIAAGAKVGTIELVPLGSYTPALVIEEGAEVGAIIYNGVTYTLAEWLAR